MRRLGPAALIASLLLLAIAIRRHSDESGTEPLATTAHAAVSEPLPPGPRPLALLQGDLMERLQRGDEAWRPRAVPLPGGGTRYLYKRRKGDPPLSLAQLRVLIANPPSFEAERRSIVNLLLLLDRLGTSVSLSPPMKQGAAAEWEARRRSLRIRPDIPDRGSVEFARVLNHEAIHVAQSCGAGSLSAKPRPLGLPLPVESGSWSASTGMEGSPGIEGESSGFRQLQSPVYAYISPSTRQAEIEAYALQDRLGLGERLVRQHCSLGRNR